MASFSDELLGAAKVLLFREPQRRGRLPDARVRRAVSTAYYALFHFLNEEATKRIVGADNRLATRRRALARNFSHSGLRMTFSKVRGQSVESSIRDFVSYTGVPASQLVTPSFARDLANVLLDALSKREDADYNRNASLSETDARILIARVEAAIAQWKAADTPSDRDFKHALFMLLLLKGQLRNDA